MIAQLLLTTLALTLGIMLLLWALSVRLRDVSIVDPWWGPGFAVIAVVAWWLGDGYAPRRLLLVAMAILWGARLGGYLLWRRRGSPEDYRYAAMRRRQGEHFWWVSLFTVFLMQGALMWVISLPLQLGQIADTPERITWLDGLGALLWGVGLFYETVGDWQLARFKADPANRGRVMDRGLWRTTRHPNYFGDACVWWGHYLVAASTPLGAWTFPSPLLMTLLLLRVSGVSLLEKGLHESKPAYRDYARRTSAFVPMPPRDVDED